MSSTARAQRLRRQQTWAEKKLWRRLRDRRFSGYKFRRQHPFGTYFLDFYCAEARLVLETDGGVHGFPDKQRQDAERDAFLQSRGMLTKHIWNHQLLSEGEWVKRDLWRLLQERAPHPDNSQPVRRVTARVLDPDKPPTSPGPSP